MRCWGNNSHGQLGNGVVEAYGFAAAPVDVVELSGATDLSAGLEFNCAVAAGAVRCWGDNGLGQLGKGDQAPSARPVAVQGLSDATVVVSGTAHSCALLKDGTIRCWGDGASGLLGDGMSAISPVPVQAMGISGATAVAAGTRATCAVLAGGTVHCWGSSAILGENPGLAPRQVGGVSGASALALGCGHACALLADGGVVCWGANQTGQLGNGGPPVLFTTVPTPVAAW